VTVEYEARGPIALVTLRRPEQFNAIDAQTVIDLDSTFSRVADDSTVRAVVITGEGKAFSAGADIKEFMQLETAFEFRAFLHDLECDLRVADARARFGVPEIKLGIVPGAGGTQRLPRLVPKAVAAQMLLTGDPVDATEAHRIGLVNEIVTHGSVVERALELATTLAARAPLAIAAAKRLLDAVADTDLEAGLEAERDESAKLFATEDRREGTAAFTEKRDPTFEGR